MANTKGIITSGDVLVNETADSVNLNALWSEIGSALALYNQHRSAIVRLLSYPTTAVADIIAQSVDGESFEEATEFGVPTALRNPLITCASATTSKTTTKASGPLGNSSGRPRLSRSAPKSRGSLKPTTVSSTARFSTGCSIPHQS